VKSIVSAQSRLTGHVIDELHSAGIEIVSPNFMNQKQVGDTVFIPGKYRTKDKNVLEENTPENVIFDKADEAEGIEKRKELLAEVQDKIKKEEQELKVVKDVEQKAKLEEKIKKTKELKDKIEDKIEIKVDQLDKKD